MPLYMVSESKQQYYNQIINIMGLNLEDLIFEKMFILFEKLTKCQTDAETAKIELQLTRSKLLMETDFSAVLGKSRTNKEEREAYMKPHLAEYKEAVEQAEAQTKFYKNKIKILNDLIKAKALALELEGALKD